MQILWLVAMLPIGVVAGCGAVYIMNHIPASWLCEYGEEPTGVLAQPGEQRLSGTPWKLVFSAFFTAVGIYLVTLGGHGMTFALPLLVCTWLLFVIAIADGKFMVIPDQFVVFLMLMSVAFMPFGARLSDMLKGAGVGAGLMLVVALIGWMISGRQSLGFGDVKLMLAIGLNTGLYGAVAVMAVASIVSGIWFAVGILRHKHTKNDMKPLGPFLSGAAIAWLVLV